MRQMTFEGPGRARWHEVPEPRLPSDVAAIVEPVAAATCDADVGLMRGKAGDFWGTGFAMGHEAVVRVVDVGDGARERRPGDLAVVPFQISCGQCEWCGRGHTAHCTTLPDAPMYGLGPRGGDFGGTLCDRFVVPFADHMLVPLPEGVTPHAVASASDNLPDAHRAVTRGLRHAPGGDVLVVGGRGASIALYAVLLARALGAASVSYTDRDPRRLARAEQLGATPLEWPRDGRVGRFAITIDSSGSPTGLRVALLSTDHEGICVNVAMLFGDATLPMLDMYVDGVTLVVARNSARAHIPHVLQLVASGAIDPTPVTDRVVAWDDAEDALADPPDKLVVLGPHTTPA
jgi:alcohol dehydrogenase